MTKITLTDNENKMNNLLYIKSSLGELFAGAGAVVREETADKRARLVAEIPDCYYEIVKAEIADRLGEVVAVNYKYGFFKEIIKVSGLSRTEYEIMLARVVIMVIAMEKPTTCASFREA